ncbi:MAG: MFS transporter [Caldimicrobium sp.]|nr:MFS transporter [Caldimicrobium sp.]
MIVIFLFGLTSLFSDFVYEGARGIMGPYLALLGANAMIVGLVSGLGEFLGYAMRLFSGYLVFKTRRYWGWVFGGYIISLLSIPALALVSTWMGALVLLLLERLGKAIRTPARDTLLSLAVIPKRSGVAFGVHEALDQLGALLGPLFISLMLYLGVSYKGSFLSLVIPALVALFVLALTKRFYQSEEVAFATGVSKEIRSDFTGAFWLYVLGIAFFGASMFSFYLIGFHLQNRGFASQYIPLMYALAMAIDALAALFWGWLFDRKGLKILPLSSLSLLASVPLIFLGPLPLIVLGIVLWGIALGALESIMRSALTFFVPREKRALGFGIFHFLLGLAIMIGNLLYGYLYDKGLIMYLIILVFSFQIVSAALLFCCQRSIRNNL